MAEYSVYPLYGKDRPNCFGCKYILGTPRIINDIKGFKLDLYGLKRTLLIVDWKSRRYKTYVNGYQSNWIRFKISEWWDHFRFSSPCEDWELESKGAISDAHNYQNVIDFSTFNHKEYCHIDTTKEG